MNQEEVKEKLRIIHESAIEYEVIFSGKKSNRVNGLYRPLTKEIIIHNKNFIDEKGNQNESLLMYTAIHELSHHIMMAEKGQPSSRAHNQDFWAAFHGLLDIAEKKGVYRAEIDAETQKLIDEVREISLKIAGLQRELGRVILAVNEAGREKGIRREDIIERKAQISRQTMKSAVSAYNMGDKGAGIDIQTIAAKQRYREKQNAVIESAQTGKSYIQAKKTVEKPAEEPEPEKNGDEISLSRLILEKKRLERTIGSLMERLEEIKRQITAGNDDDTGAEMSGQGEILRLTG
jgi:hypothetical protein